MFAVTRKPVQRECLIHSRPGAPIKGAKSTSPNEKARFGMREKVIYHKTLSDGAVRVYALLDDMSAFRGYCSPKEKTLAAKAHCGTRSVSRFVRELKTGGFVAVAKSQHHPAYYILGWLPIEKRPDTPKLSGLRIQTRQNRYSDTPNLSETEARILITEPSIESSTPKCTKCEDLGRIGSEICGCVEGAAVRARLRRKRA